MMRIMCKSKIHNAKITSKKLYYDGSISISKDLLEASQILPGEKVQVVNLNNGNRFATYVVEAKTTGEVGLLGPAARLGEIGDRIIIISYCIIEDEKAKGMKPKVVKVDENNKSLE